MSQFKTLSLMLLIFFATVSIFIISFAKTTAQTSNDSVKVQLIVENCNYNNICEPSFGENFQGCASDCQPPPPATTTPPSSRKSGSHQSLIIIATVIPGDTFATITWETDSPTRSIIKWGTTLDYESGAIAEISYGTYHEIKLNNLTSGTRYFYKIEATDEIGFQLDGQGQFFTLPSPDTIAPSNVSGIHIELKNNLSGNYLHITWTNPDDFDFENVRIIRSTNFYVLDPTDQIKIYQGKENSYDDFNIIPNADYYYSFFTQDSDGNFSSGALAHVRLQIISDQITKNPYGLLYPENNNNASSSQPLINISDFDVMQPGSNANEWIHLIFDNGIATAEIAKPIIMIINKDELITGTKYILISFEDENNAKRFNTYWIRPLKDENIYQANIPAFHKVGNYSFFVTFLNSDKKVISQSHGVFQVQESEVTEPYSIFNLIYLWISQIIKWVKAFLATILSL